MSIVPPPPDLDDGVVRVRRWAEQDLDCVRLAATDPAIPDGTTVPPVFTPEEGLAFIHRQWSRLDSGEGISFAIALTGSDVAVGLIVLLRRHYEGVFTLGYWLIPSARGDGLARRAVALVVDWAIGLDRVRRIEAHVEPSNPASMRTLERAGFEREGLLRNYLHRAGRQADVYVYSVVS